MHRKTNFLVNLYWDNKYSDSDSDLSGDNSELKKFGSSNTCALKTASFHSHERTQCEKSFSYLDDFSNSDIKTGILNGLTGQNRKFCSKL